MKEQVVFAIDTNQDPSRLDITRKLLKRFVIQKQRLLPSQRIGIILLSNDSSWVLPFTSNQVVIMNVLDEIESRVDYEWDAESFLESIHGCLPSKNEILRVILIYGRSNCIPTVNSTKMQQFYASNPNCFIDIVYLHEKQSPENRVQEIFDTLGLLESKYSRSFEITRNYKRYLLAMTELLGNPSHRSNKPRCHYWDFMQ